VGDMVMILGWRKSLVMWRRFDDSQVCDVGFKGEGSWKDAKLTVFTVSWALKFRVTRPGQDCTQSDQQLHFLIRKEHTLLKNGWAFFSRNQCIN
jgi:hypothetical protein